MVNKRSIRAGLALGLAVVAFGCAGTSPTDPSVDADTSGPAVQAVTPTPAPSPTPAPVTTPDPGPTAECHPEGRLEAVITDDGKGSGKAKVKVKNSSAQCTYPFTWVSYNMPTGRLEDQTVFDYKSVTVRPGERQTLIVDVPPCSYQLDGPIADSPLVPPFYNRTWPGTRYLVVYAQISRGSCTPTPNPSPTPTPQPSPSPTPSPSPSPTPTPPPTCAGVGEPTFNMTKSEAATTAGVTSTLTFPGGFTGNITLAPSPVSGFSGGSVTSGNPNNSTYNRPAAGQPVLTVNGSWQVKKGNEVCKAGTGSVSISPQPPERNCGDINVRGSAQVNGTSATVSSNWNGSGTGTIKLDGGAAQSIGNGGSVTYNGLSYGDHSAVITVVEGRLTCAKTVTFTVRRPTCDAFPPPVITLTPNVTTTATQVTVNSITANPSGGTFNPNPPQTYERPVYGSPSQTKTFTYTLTYTPADGLQCTARKDVDVRVPPREPTCGEQNPPRFDAPSVSNSGGTLSITQRVYNSGSWSGTLYAGTSGNPHQYTKDSDTDEVACGGNDTLSVSYQHQGHSACYWTYELKRNGTLQSGYPIVVLNRCQ